jgi:Flp pilus assembly protein TadD
MILLVASLLTFGASTIDPDAFQLNEQGRLLLNHHRYSAAVPVFQRAVERAASDIGPRDPATAMMLRNLALAYVQTGNSVAAEQSAKLAFSILESRFGSADPALTPILNVLAECYASSGRVDEAERASEQAVAIGPLAGVHYGIALHNLGALRELSGDRTNAAAFYKHAVEVKTETLGAAHPYVAISKAALRRVQSRTYLASGAPIKLELATE